MIGQTKFPHIQRKTLSEALERLQYYPGVVLLGPRQVGKTTLARAIAELHQRAMFLDLERASDRAQLQNPEAFLAAHRDRLVILDEVQALPNIFEALRPETDAKPRAGRFLLLSSASGKLLKQCAGSLAGRVSSLELSPLLTNEILPQTYAGASAKTGIKDLLYCNRSCCVAASP